MARIVSHRGAAALATENTLPAFTKAIEIGADIAEMDVHLTRDQQVVVFHDHNLLRLTGRDQNIKDLSLAEIRRVRLKDGSQIPTLQQVVDICKDKIDMMIELKAAGTATAVAEIIDKNQIDDQVLIASFNPALLQLIKKIHPQIPIILVFKHYSNFFLSSSAKRVWRTAAKLEPQYIGPRAEIVTHRMVYKAHAQGLKVYAYTVPNKKFGERLIRWGVDLIGANNATWFL